MVFHVVSNLAQLSAHPPAFVPYPLTDEQLLDLDFESVCDFIETDPGDLTEDTRRQVETIADIVARLRDRRLFVRGFAIAGTMTNDAYKEDPQHPAGPATPCRNRQPPGQGTDHGPDLSPRSDPLESLGSEELLTAFGNSMPAYVQLSPPPSAPEMLGTDADHAFLIDEDGTSTSFTDDAPEDRRPSHASHRDRRPRPRVSAEGLAPYVDLGTEVEALRHGVRHPDARHHAPLHQAREGNTRRAPPRTCRHGLLRRPSRRPQGRAEVVHIRWLRRQGR